MNSSNKKVFIIVAIVIVVLLLCCCVSGFAAFFLIRTSTINNIKDQNSYLYNPATEAPSPTSTITPTNERSLTLSDLTKFTAQVMTTFKKDGPKEVYNSYADESYKDAVTLEQF